MSLMNDPAVDELCRLSASQHGLVTFNQARGVGLTESAWRHQLATGSWEAISRRIARRAGAPVTCSQHLLAAVLDAAPDAYISHGSAAALWGLPGFRAEPIELMVLRGRRDRRGLPATIHRPRHLPQPFAAEIDGVPVVRPALLLLQLAPQVSPERLKRLLDALWNRRLLSGRSVRRELAELMHRGRCGTVALRYLLDSLPDDYVPPASGLEGRFAQILADAGLPQMRRQVDLGDDERWCGRVDFLDVRLPLVIEVDSERYHSALSSELDDVARQRRLEAAGYFVERVTDFQVWHRPGEVVAIVHAARQGLLRRAA